MAEITRFVQDFLSLSGPHQTEPVPLLEIERYLFAAHAADPLVGLRTIAFASSADTDTLASMLGGLFGLSHGLEWIPDTLQHVQDYALIADVAAQLIQPNRPTVCPSNDSSSVLSYQELPTSIQCGEAIARRRKDDRRVGITLRGPGERWCRCSSRVRPHGCPYSRCGSYSVKPIGVSRGRLP